MNPSFLHTVATQIYERYNQNLLDTWLVFPNKRQASYFENHFVRLAGLPCIMPNTVTIEQLVALAAKHPIADNFTQVFTLYEAFSEVFTKLGNPLPQLERLYSVAETLVNDFNEMDSYLLDVQSVCSTVYDLEKTGQVFESLTDEQKAYLQSFWHGIAEPGILQERFLDLWKNLPTIYTLWHQLLQQKGLTTLGYGYRQLAQATPGNNAFLPYLHHLAFIGFNAFNHAEITGINRWQETGICSLWFDSDQWYLNDTQQEAGFFLRKYITQLHWKNQLPASNQIAEKRTQLQVVEQPGNQAQAQYIQTWIQQVPEIENAAILLADEELLLPVLQSLPNEIIAANITMGMPVKSSIVFKLITQFFDFHLLEGNHQEVPLHWLRGLQNHPLLFLSEQAQQAFEKLLNQKKQFAVPLKSLCQLGTDASLFFAPLLSPIESFDRLQQLLEWLSQQAAVSNLEKGFMSACWPVLQQFKKLLGQAGITQSLSLMAKLTTRHLSSLRIPFEGNIEPGIQVMGLLESRGLDFDHILLLGAGEGKLPKIKAPNSYLPFNIRRAFGLPIPEYQDAIFAYVFYRLLHRSKTMHLVYNNLVTDGSSGEPSRFIRQLEFELNYRFISNPQTPSIVPLPPPKITIQKSAFLLSIMAQRLHTLSPSGINSYLKCRLQFYFRYLANLKPPDVPDQGVNALDIGSVVHRMMELIYHNCPHLVTDAWLTEQNSRLESIADLAFTDVLLGKGSKQSFQFNGEWKVARSVAIAFTKSYLTMDRQYAPFTIVSLENKVSHSWQIALNGHHREITIGGNIDRVDRKANTYRIVDYKTGGDTPLFASVPELFERDSKKNNSAALQILLYSLVVKRANKDWPHAEPALYALRHMNKTNDSVRLQAGKQELVAEALDPILIEAEAYLLDLMQELFNPNEPFDQTNLLDRCSYCDYNGICSRH